MRSDCARIGIAALLVLGSAGRPAASMPAADGKTASAVPTDAPGCTPPKGPVDRPGYCGYPADIRAFIDDRDACDHWRGEPVPEHEDDPDEVRKKEILEAMDESCRGTDERLAALKASYAGDPRILGLLDEFEPDIESND